jgi:hypothetical protein
LSAGFSSVVAACDEDGAGVSAGALGGPVRPSTDSKRSPRPPTRHRRATAWIWWGASSWRQVEHVPAAYRRLSVRQAASPCARSACGAAVGSAAESRSINLQAFARLSRAMAGMSPRLRPSSASSPLE